MGGRGEDKPSKHQLYVLIQAFNTKCRLCQKYEHMSNRITADKLIEVCNSLDVSLQTFQDGDPYQVLDGADISILKKEQALMVIEKLSDRHETQLLIQKKIMENTHDQSSSR